MTIEPGETYVANDGQRVVAGFLRHQRVWYGRQAGAYPFSMGIVAFLDQFKLLRGERLVREKMMKRFFFAGRSYSSKKQAYLMAAKYELRKEIVAKLGEYALRDQVEEEYTRRFPHDEEGLCTFTNGGLCRGKDDPHELNGYDDGGPKFAWCKTKWKAWLEAKAAELMEADERKS